LSKGLGLSLACLLLWLAPAANADVIYQYTGNPFTTVPSPYTVGDIVSGTIQLSAALPPNSGNVLLGSNTPISLDGYSFSDGVGTLTSANSIVALADVSTNGSGVITVWSFEFSGTGHGIVSQNVPPGPGSIQDLGDTTVRASVVNNPGTWTLVPEPSTLTLFGLAIALLVWARKPLG
jgi:hypothetical protein